RADAPPARPRRRRPRPTPPRRPRPRRASRRSRTGRSEPRNADRPGPSLPDPSSAITDRGHARTRNAMMTTESPRSLLRPAGAAPALADDPAETQLEATPRSGEDVLTGRSAAAVQPLPGEQGEDEAYVWAFFTGEGVGGEEISLAASRGNDALSWNTLNDGEPLFESEFGEEGLRDPFILRSPDGDRFFLIATDLKIDGRPDGFAGAQQNGSLAVEVWESTDLVNWSEQRHVVVSDEHAGNT